MGLDLLEKDALDYCKPHTDIAQNMIPELLRDHEPVYAYLTPKRHYDIGTFKSLEDISKILGQQKRTGSQPIM